MFLTITSDFFCSQLCIVRGFPAHKASPWQLAPGDYILLLFIPPLYVCVQLKLACLPISSPVFLGRNLYNGYTSLWDSRRHWAEVQDFGLYFHVLNGFNKISMNASSASPGPRRCWLMLKDIAMERISGPLEDLEKLLPTSCICPILYPRTPAGYDRE